MLKEKIEAIKGDKFYSAKDTMEAISGIKEVLLEMAELISKKEEVKDVKKVTSIKPSSKPKSK